MIISQYQKRFRREVKRICLNGKEDEFSLALCKVYAESYMDINAENSLFLQSENGEVKGYVLCYPDYKSWKENLLNYVKDGSELEKAIALGSLSAMEPYAEEYPAHIHIDLDPSVQHQGYGTLMLRCLEEKLLNQNVRGYMLNVSIDNLNAIRFYQRNRFTEIGRNEMEIAFGKKLGKIRKKK